MTDSSSSSTFMTEEDYSTINIWEKVLSESSRSVADRLQTKTVVVLGDRSSGKSSLLARVQGNDLQALRRGVALDYSFIDVKSREDDEIVSRLHIWQPEGDVEYKSLLKFGLNESTFSNALVIIALDFTQPWNLVDSLKRWLSILENHLITNVYPKLPSGLLEELKNYLIYEFQQYTSISNSGATASSEIAPGRTIKKRKMIDEQSLLPLGDGIFDKNLGIPIIIVCCKTDYMVQLEKEFNYKDAHFDYIQTALRRICLSYGSALLYCSAKKNRNCEILLPYIEYRLLGFEFPHKAQLLEKDILFVPSGIDSLNKIKIDFDNQPLSKDPDEPYQEVIAIPKRLLHMRAQNRIEALIIAEEDQEFLAKNKEMIERDLENDKEDKRSGGVITQLIGEVASSMVAAPGSAPATGSRGSLSLLSSNVSTGGGGIHIPSSLLPNVRSATASISNNNSAISGIFSSSSTTDPTSSSNSVLPTSSNLVAPTSKNPGIAKSSKPSAATSAITNTHTETAANEHQVLSNFFNSLIHKERDRTSSRSSGIDSHTKGKTASLNAATREDVAKQLEKLKVKTITNNK